jgi:hypothetical protein
LILVSDGGGAREARKAFLYVYVENTDKAYQRALEAGALTIEKPSTRLTATGAPRCRTPGATSGKLQHMWPIR